MPRAAFSDTLEDQRKRFRAYKNSMPNWSQILAMQAFLKKYGAYEVRMEELEKFKQASSNPLSSSSLTSHTVFQTKKEDRAENHFEQVYNLLEEIDELVTQ